MHVPWEYDHPAFYVSTTLCLLYVILYVSTNTKHVIQLVSTNTKHVIQLKKYKLTDDSECACACWSFRAANIVKAGSENRTTTRAGPRLYDRTTTCFGVVAHLFCVLLFPYSMSYIYDHVADVSLRVTK